MGPTYAWVWRYPLIGAPPRIQCFGLRRGGSSKMAVIVSLSFSAADFSFSARAEL